MLPSESLDAEPLKLTLRGASPLLTLIVNDDCGDWFVSVLAGVEMINNCGGFAELNSSKATTRFDPVASSTIWTVRAKVPEPVRAA
jgi:hypothetical protein